MGRLLAIVGPTATGKSDLAVEVAIAAGGEVVNADSMQLYRGMDIGTAKLTLDQRRGVPHHVLDVWPVTRTATVADYQALARAAIESVQAAGRLPVLVGGSGLYVRAAVDRMRFPGTDPQVRAALEAELAEHGPAPLHERLRRVDPAAAAAIEPSNGRRIMRALEVVQITGAPFTAQLPSYDAVDDLVLVGLDPDLDALDRRVQDRAERMVVGGLVEEVEALVAEGLRDGVTASRALGYAQVLAMLDGTLTPAAMVERTVQATRRFVRRQLSWFRRDPRIHWLPMGATDLPDRVLALAAG